MLLSLSWLREFVPYEGSAEALADRLTMLGLELEEILHPFEALEPLVVGRVVECVPHPNSDHMHCCKVDAGQGELLSIVCGAPNVAAGQTVAVALVGTTMPGGLTIKKAKLRGEPSFGMICSEREMGLSEDHSGILVLPDTLVPGTKIVDALNLERDVLDIDITPNRADCLSVIGLAREVALAFDLPMTIKQRPLILEHVDAPHPTIEIEDPELCPCYCGRVLTGVKVAPSPAAIRYRLASVGVRAISNIVDVTNYILMECGQPLHSFDLGKIRGGRIRVACAGEGERFATLDGQERVLCSRDITIRDAEGPVALGGVMGGLASEITDASAGVFLEAATFRPASIRVTSRRLGLSSESSFRFERGIDQQRIRWSLDRASAMVVELAGGHVSDRLCENEPKPFAPAIISYRPARCSALIGEEPGLDFSRKVLAGLGCEIAEDKGEEWVIPQPSWRPDLTREADLIEEVARYYGMDRVEPVLPSVERNLDDLSRPESPYAFALRLKHWACGLGLNEAVCYSFVGQKDLDALNLPTEGRIAIRNPLSADQDVLRTALTPGLLNALKVNMGQSSQSVRLFEVASVFTEDASSYTGARETQTLAFLLSGARYDKAWPHKAGELDYLDIKGIAEDLFRFLHVGSAEYTLSENHPFLLPAVDVTIGGEKVGVIGRVKAEPADRANARTPVWVAEFNLEVLRALYDKGGISFRQLDVFPPVRRDITVIAPAGMQAKTIVEAISGMKLPLLQEAVLVDLFEPKDQDVRNLTFRLTFRNAQRTLRDAEVDKERDKVAAGLVKQLGVRI